MGQQFEQESSKFQSDIAQKYQLFTNQQNISNEFETMLHSQVKEFQSECKKPAPNQSKLKLIVNSVMALVKDVGILLLKHELCKGITLLLT